MGSCAGTRFWLSNEQWKRIEPHLPTDVRGVERVDDRRVISGIVHVLKSGCRWCDCPPDMVLRHNRFVRWARRGVWENLYPRNVRQCPGSKGVYRLQIRDTKNGPRRQGRGTALPSPNSAHGDIREMPLCCAVLSGLHLSGGGDWTGWLTLQSTANQSPHQIPC